MVRLLVFFFSFPARAVAVGDERLRGRRQRAGGTGRATLSKRSFCNFLLLLRCYIIIPQKEGGKEARQIVEARAAEPSLSKRGFLGVGHR